MTCADSLPYPGNGLLERKARGLSEFSAGEEDFFVTAVIFFTTPCGLDATCLDELRRVFAGAAGVISCFFFFWVPSGFTDPS